MNLPRMPAKIAFDGAEYQLSSAQELHVNMGLTLDPMNGLALDLRAMLQEFIHKDYIGALEDLRRLKEHPVYKKPGLDEVCVCSYCVMLHLCCYLCLCSCLLLGSYTHMPAVLREGI